MSACGGAEAESETELSLSLGHYQSQLSTVTDALRHVQAGGERSELEECRAALVELIAITQEKLLGAKNARLAAETITLDSCGESEHGDGAEASTSAPAHCATASNNGTTADCDGGAGPLATVIGMHCTAPMCSAGLRYHSAIVYDIIVPDDDDCGPMTDDLLDDIKVSVMFTRPLRTAMRPCEYFLSDRCKFGDNCRYSHGTVFKFSELLDEEDEQVEWQASVGDKCLVAPDDNAPDERKLWRVGHITCVDGDTAAVRLIETGDECGCELERLQVLSRHAFLPCAEQRDDCDATSIMCVDDTAAPVPSLGDDSDGIRNERNASVFAVGELGSWEQHTKGIGSKLMSKMGYVRGRGLGKDKQGRLEPVQVTYCPKGKSLDKCMQLRQAVKGFAKHDGATAERRDILKLLRNELRQKRAKEKRRAEKVKKQALAESDDVFDFLNETLGDKARKAKNKSASQKQQELKKTSDKELNVKLLQADSGIAALERDMVRHRDTFERMDGKDAHTAAKLTSRMNEARAKIAAMHRKKYQLANEKSKRDSEKKLSVF